MSDLKLDIFIEMSNLKWTKRSECPIQTRHLDPNIQFQPPQPGDSPPIEGPYKAVILLPYSSRG